MTGSSSPIGIFCSKCFIFITESFFYFSFKNSDDHGNGSGKCNGHGKCNGTIHGNGNGYGGVTGQSRLSHGTVTGRSRLSHQFVSRFGQGD